jgi:hypothetical protein
MKNRISLILLCCASLLLAGLAASTKNQADTTTKGVMKSKLHYSQGVLEGIATENYNLMATNAQNLSGLSQAANWQIRQTPEYQRFTTDFRRQADALAKSAKEKNVDAATVAYFQLTVSCVNCHKYLRGASTAKLDDKSSSMLFAVAQK